MAAWSRPLGDGPPGGDGQLQVTTEGGPGPGSVARQGGGKEAPADARNPRISVTSGLGRWRRPGQIGEARQRAIL